MDREDLPRICCSHCRKLLARGWAATAEIEFFCPRCGSYTILRATRPNPAGHRASQVETLWQSNADPTTRHS
ncbi:Com family DNA-binding transcriptional regulator [uncultured Desulfovibrio sp.]|uniref:Com family DNA-binding transcriptional regulator n=1 Tax=uncultured Desulfovibrio sp. TaxID=167968 RepID=UPI0026379576|nr:Com family DNA-binding transcriptional regulator [uncultured Desulfovibrio sp.]